MDDGNAIIALLADLYRQILALQAENTKLRQQLVADLPQSN